MRNIQIVSSYLIWILNFLLIFIPLFIMGQWFLIDWNPFRQLIANSPYYSLIPTPEGAVYLLDMKFTLLSKSIWLLSNLVGSLPLFLGVFILKGLFENYRRGNIFSLENAKKYKFLGWLCFFDGLFVLPIGKMLEVLAATLSNPPGHRYITINFGTPNLEALFLGFIVIVISWVMVEGYKLQKDQELTV